MEESKLEQAVPLPEDINMAKNRKGASPYVLRGWLTSESRGDQIRVRITEFVRWSMDRSPSLRGYWIQTKHAWYWLKEPSEATKPIGVRIRCGDEDEEAVVVEAALPSMDEVHMEMRARQNLVSELCDVFLFDEAEPNAYRHLKHHSKHKPLQVYQDLIPNEEQKRQHPDHPHKPFDYELLQSCPLFVKEHLVDIHEDLNEKCVFIKSLKTMKRSTRVWTTTEYADSANDAEFRSGRLPWGEMMPNVTRVNPNWVLELGVSNQIQAILSGSKTNPEVNPENDTPNREDLFHRSSTTATDGMELVDSEDDEPARKIKRLSKRKILDDDDDDDEPEPRLGPSKKRKRPAESAKTPVPKRVIQSDEGLFDSDSDDDGPEDILRYSEGRMIEALARRQDALAPMPSDSESGFWDDVVAKNFAFVDPSKALNVVNDLSTVTTWEEKLLICSAFRQTCKMNLKRVIKKIFRVFAFPLYETWRREAVESLKPSNVCEIFLVAMCESIVHCKMVNNADMLGKVKKLTRVDWEAGLDSVVRAATDVQSSPVIHGVGKARRHVRSLKQDDPTKEPTIEPANEAPKEALPRRPSSVDQNATASESSHSRTAAVPRHKAAAVKPLSAKEKGNADRRAALRNLIRMKSKPIPTPPAPFETKLSSVSKDAARKETKERANTEPTRAATSTPVAAQPKEAPARETWTPRNESSEQVISDTGKNSLADPRRTSSSVRTQDGSGPAAKTPSRDTDKPVSATDNPVSATEVSMKAAEHDEPVRHVNGWGSEAASSWQKEQKPPMEQPTDGSRQSVAASASAPSESFSSPGGQRHVSSLKREHREPKRSTDPQDDTPLEQRPSLRDGLEKSDQKRNASSGQDQNSKRSTVSQQETNTPLGQRWAPREGAAKPSEDSSRADEVKGPASSRQDHGTTRSTEDADTLLGQRWAPRAKSSDSGSHVDHVGGQRSSETDRATDSPLGPRWSRPVRATSQADEERLQVASPSNATSSLAHDSRRSSQSGGDSDSPLGQRWTRPVRESSRVDEERSTLTAPSITEADTQRSTDTQNGPDAEGPGQNWSRNPSLQQSGQVSSRVDEERQQGVASSNEKADKNRSSDTQNGAGAETPPGQRWSRGPSLVESGHVSSGVVEERQQMAASSSQGHDNKPEKKQTLAAGATNLRGAAPMGRGRGRGRTMPAWMTRGGDGLQSAAELKKRTEEPKREPQRQIPVEMGRGRGRGRTMPAWMTRGDFGGDGSVPEKTNMDVHSGRAAMETASHANNVERREHHEPPPNSNSNQNNNNNDNISSGGPSKHKRGKNWKKNNHNHHNNNHHNNNNHNHHNNNNYNSSSSSSSNNNNNINNHHNNHPRGYGADSGFTQNNPNSVNGYNNKNNNNSNYQVPSWQQGGGSGDHGRGRGRGRALTKPAWMTAREKNGPTGEDHPRSEPRSNGNVANVGMNDGSRGRGRGRTLPAWMTQQQQHQSPQDQLQPPRKQALPPTPVNARPPAFPSGGGGGGGRGRGRGKNINLPAWMTRHKG